MGWCHEFGPQLVEGCDHPMTAGPSSCTCRRCGAVCAGRFAGCADVWDRAAGQVVAAPVAPLQVGAFAGPDPTEPSPAPERQPDPSPAALERRGPPPLNGTEISAVLAHLFERVEALERTAPSSPSAQAELEPLGELAEQTADQLDQHRARTIERLDELAASVTTLTDLPDRVSALEWVEDGTTAVKEALSELGRGLDRLSVESERLLGIPERVSALEQSPDRTTVLEEAVADLGATLEQVSQQLHELSTVPDQVQAMELAAATAGDAFERQREGMERSVADLGGALDELCERLARLSALPPRVDALERAAFGGGPVHRRSRSIVADVDALQGQVEDVANAVDGVPQRLATVERSTGRTEALERGLAGAIDMIDQLVAQLAALEWACRPLPPPDEAG